jgi:poly(3-hydroxybutyrate) depolymerase
VQSPDYPTINVAEHQATAEDGHTVPIRLLRPINKSGPFPLLVWFHGGGQVLGYAAQDDPTLKKLAAEVGRAVAAVNCRLAPEAPAAAEDGLGAYLWLKANAAMLNLDGGKIDRQLANQAAHGASAGEAAGRLLLRWLASTEPPALNGTYRGISCRPPSCCVAHRPGCSRRELDGCPGDGWSDILLQGTCV